MSQTDPRRQDHVYIMRNSRIPDQFKVGRSQDVIRRKNDLERSQNFEMEILAIFPDAGRHEIAIHRALAHLAVPEIPGREWFFGPLAGVVAVIVDVAHPACK